MVQATAAADSARLATAHSHSVAMRRKFGDQSSGGFRPGNVLFERLKPGVVVVQTGARARPESIGY